jgi:hypothetical protein
VEKVHGREISESGYRFTNRVIDAFEAMGYQVEICEESAEFDFIISRYQFPLEIKALVEIKYFERNLVPASIVYRYLELIKKHPEKKAIIVTTIGFSEEAKVLAEESEGRIVLLNEIDLMESIPRRYLEKYYDSFLESNYISSTIHDYILERQPSYEKMISKISRKELCQLLMEFVSFEEINNLILRRIPRKVLFKKYEEKLNLADIKQMFAQLPRRIRIPISRKKKIKELYEEAKANQDPNQKGKLFEKVVKEIFELVPDIKFIGSNINDSMEEIDIQLRNHNHEHVWADFGGVVFIECKNWSKPAGAKEIDSFKSKLERNGLKVGIFVAVNGITGSPSKLEGAWGIIKMYLQSGYKIVVLEGNDLEDIFKCADVSEKVDEKYIFLYKLGSNKSQT